jgi:Domain of unknown function (DUF4440)
MQSIRSGNTFRRARLTGALWALAITLSLPAAAAAPSAKATSAPRQAQFLQLQQQLLTALVAADWPRVADMWSDDLVYIHPFGIVGKKEQLEVLTNGPSPRYKSIEAKDTRVRIFRDTAILTGNVYFTGITATEPRLFYLSTVWANEHGTWRMVLWHAVRAETPPPG